MEPSFGEIALSVLNIVIYSRTTYTHHFLNSSSTLEKWSATCVLKSIVEMPGYILEEFIWTVTSKRIEICEWLFSILNFAYLGLYILWITNLEAESHPMWHFTLGFLWFCKCLVFLQIVFFFWDSSLSHCEAASYYLFFSCYFFFRFQYAVWCYWNYCSSPKIHR